MYKRFSEVTVRIQRNMSGPVTLCGFKEALARAFENIIKH